MERSNELLVPNDGTPPSPMVAAPLPQQSTKPISRPMFFPAVVEDSLRQMARPLSIGRPSPSGGIGKQNGYGDDDELRDCLLEEFEMK